MRTDTRLSMPLARMTEGKFLAALAGATVCLVLMLAGGVAAKPSHCRKDCRQDIKNCLGLVPPNKNCTGTKAEKKACRKNYATQRKTCHGLPKLCKQQNPGTSGTCLLSSTTTTTSTPTPTTSPFPTNTTTTVTTHAPMTTTTLASPIFAENFDSYPLGAFPSSGGWELLYSGLGSSYQYVGNTEFVSPSQSLHLVGSSCWSATAYHPVALPPQVTLEGSVFVEQIVTCGCTPLLATISLYDPTLGTFGTTYGRVSFNCDGNIYAQEAFNLSAQVLLMPYSTGKWYHIRVDVDLVARSFDVYVDGVVAASSLQILDSGTPTGVEVSAGHGANPTPWFDDISVTLGSSLTTTTTATTSSTTTTTTSVTLPPTTSTTTTGSTTTSTTSPGAPTCANGGIACGAPCGPAGAGVCYGTQAGCNATAALLCTSSDPPKCLGATVVGPDCYPGGCPCSTDAECPEGLPICADSTTNACTIKAHNLCHTVYGE